MMKLYHYTTFQNLKSILTEGRLFSDIHEISLTRDKFFHLKNSRETTGITGLDVRILLNTNKLKSSHYKIRPIQEQAYSDDQEERVYTKEIYDVEKFIEKISVIQIDLFEYCEERYDIEKLTQFYKIPIFPIDKMMN